MVAQNSAQLAHSVRNTQKIEYKHNEGKRYHIFGYKSEDNKWNPNNGELILVTHEKQNVEKLKEKIYTIDTNHLYCKQCFENKNTDPQDRFFGMFIWDGFNMESLKKIQNNLLLTIEDFSWANVSLLTVDDRPFVAFGPCIDCAKESGDEQNNLFNKYKEDIKSITKKIAAKFVINGTERTLEKYIADHLEIIETGLKLVTIQEQIKNGIIDIIAVDKNNKFCVIELKVVSNDKNIVWQAAYYQSQFVGEDVRVITITPGYTSAIYSALKNIKNVEIKKYTIDDNGFLKIVDFTEPLNAKDSEEEAS